MYRVVADIAVRPATPRLMRRSFIWLAVALLSGSCGGSPDSTTTDPVVAEAPTEAAPELTTTTSSTIPVPETTATTGETGGAIFPAEPEKEEEGTTTTTAASAGPGEDRDSDGSESDQAPPLIEGLGAKASAQVRETVAIVEKIRGLEFDELPSITVLSHEDFVERVRMETASQSEEVKVDEALYKLLGLLAPHDDLAALYEEWYSQSVAGFYSSDRREMVLPRSGDEFSALQTLTLLHELVHALTDQHFGFGPKVDSLVDAQRYDPASGWVALVEGDATLSEILYLQSLTPAQRTRLMTEIAQMEVPDLEVPLFIEKAFYFPYERGLEYVLNAWQAGGWEAVNDLYFNPPASTEEIYDGAASPDTRPIQLGRPKGVLPGEYQEIYDSTWGFLDILLMFEQMLGPGAALDAAIGWGGGRSLVGYHQGGEVVFVWEYAGDSPQEAEELALLLYDYAAEGMDVGLPVRSDREAGFSGSAGDYVFVGLVPDGLVMVACSDPAVCPWVIAPYLP